MSLAKLFPPAKEQEAAEQDDAPELPAGRK